MDSGPFKDCERIEYSEQLKMEVSTKNTYKESSNRKEQKTWENHQTLEWQTSMNNKGNKGKRQKWQAS